MYLMDCLKGALLAGLAANLPFGLAAGMGLPSWPFIGCAA